MFSYPPLFLDYQPLRSSRHIQLVAFLIALMAVFIDASCRADENIISMAMGFQGVKRLAQSVELQDEIELSPKQLEHLKTELKQLNEEFVRIRRSEIQNRAGFELAEERATKVADKMALKSLQKSQFTSEQIKRLRCVQVCKRCRFPSEFFVEILLKEIGLSKSEIEEVLSAVNPPVKDMNHLLDKHLRQALRGIFRSHDSAKKRVMNLVGNELFDGEELDKIESIEQLELGPHSVPFAQLVYAAGIIFPKGHELTPEQMQAVHRATDNVSYNTSVVALRKTVADILTPTQRLAVFRGIHEVGLRTDIAWLTRPEVLKYLKVTDVEEFELKESVTEWREAIVIARMKEEKKILQVGLNAMTKERRDAVSSLIEGVWDK